MEMNGLDQHLSQNLFPLYIKIHMHASFLTFRNPERGTSWECYSTWLDKVHQLTFRKLENITQIYPIGYTDIDILGEKKILTSVI